MLNERIIKYCQGQLNKKDQDELLKNAFQDSELKAELIDYQHLYSLMRLHPDAADLPSGKVGYINFKQLLSRQKRKTFLLAFVRYAAIIFFVIVSTWMFSYYHFAGNKISQQNLIAFRQELFVPAGQRAQLTLPDGTKVWLNAGSRLSYPSVFGKERKVFLSGEGFFDVARNEKIPFIVSTKTIDIKALGTQFNVFCYPETDYTSIYLQTGSVKAYFPGSEAKGVTLTPNQYIVQRDSLFNFETMDADNLLWREGLYSFKKQKLGSIIKKLELYYDVKIVVKDKEILNYEYVGKFRQRDGVFEILQLIQRIHKFDIERDKELNQIVLSK